MTDCKELFDFLDLCYACGLEPKIWAMPDGLIEAKVTTYAVDFLLRTGKGEDRYYLILNQSSIKEITKETLHERLYSYE